MKTRKSLAKSFVPTPAGRDRFTRLLSWASGGLVLAASLAVACSPPGELEPQRSLRQSLPPGAGSAQNPCGFAPAGRAMRSKLYLDRGVAVVEASLKFVRRYSG